MKFHLSPKRVTIIEKAKGPSKPAEKGESLHHTVNENLH